MLARNRIKRNFLKREQPNAECVVNAQIPVAKLLRSTAKGRSIRKQQLESEVLISSVSNVETPYGRSPMLHKGFIFSLFVPQLGFALGVPTYFVQEGRGALTGKVLGTRVPRNRIPEFLFIFA